MRLLNTTSLKLESFVGDEIPRYAILSHRWETEEILFEDVQTDKWHQRNRKKGVDKVMRACFQASEDLFEYIWIDTCCIDKSSSAELSEAINSMFNWYHQSRVCYVYLSDVRTEDFTQSKWFTRGWTLQELIAPQRVQFFDSQWRKIGDRASLLESIVKVTAIDRRVLGRGQRHQHCQVRIGACPYMTNCGCEGIDSYRTFRQLLSSFSVATRMSWASDRVTTRVEDQAYSLLGLFDVNMPLLYGEGTKAFLRLQEEIVRISNDQSILAGHHRPFISNSFVDIGDRFGSLFPTHPRAFQHAANLERPSASSKYLSMALTNRCLNIDLLVCPCWWQHDMDCGITSGWLGILACVYSDDSLSRPAILLDKLSGTGNDQHVFTRTQINDGSSIRLSPGALSDSSGDVEISEGKLLVGLDPSRIEMMNVDLLIYSPKQTQATARAPAIRINPTIGGHDGMRYGIRASFPELQKTPNGRVRDVILTLKDRQGKIAVKRGLLAIDDESGHGFFVAYGFAVCDGSFPEEVDYVTPPAFVPWCRLLTRDQVAPQRELMSEVTHEDMADFTRFNDDPRIRFYNPRIYRGESPKTAQLHGSMDRTGKRGFRAQVAMTPKTFLGQTAYELEISVQRFVHRKPKIQDMVDEISYMSLSQR